MQKLSRREALRGTGVAALAVAGLGLGGHAVAASPPDPLLDGVERYLTEMQALNKSSGLSDEQLDDWIDRADEILTSSLRHPVSTASGALALLALVVQEGYNAFGHVYYGDELRARSKEAVKFLAINL